MNNHELLIPVFIKITTGQEAVLLEATCFDMAHAIATFAAYMTGVNSPEQAQINYLIRIGKEKEAEKEDA